MNNDQRLSPALRQEYTTKVVLTGAFFSLFGLLAFLFERQARQRSDRRQPGDFRPMDLLLLGLATFRLGHLVAYDRVAEPFRQPFAQTVPDSTGAGDSVEPRGEGARQAIGQLITCPICAGTWIAAALVYGLEILPGPTRMLMAIMGAAGFSEFINSLSEAFCWIGQLARILSGQKMSPQNPTQAALEWPTPRPERKN